MTGFGEAQYNDDDISIGVELRSVNHKHLKVNARLGDGYNSLEAQVEALIRTKIRRGAVQVSLRVEHAIQPDAFRLNIDVLRAYIKQLEEHRDELGQNLLDPARLDHLLTLPGVAEERAKSQVDLDREQPLIMKTISTALDQLSEMRSREGALMTDNLSENIDQIVTELAKIETRAPLVVESYRTRLYERLEKVLADCDIQLEYKDILREVGIFAERSDISEEIIRLKAHIEQFNETIGLPESSGRKMDFITQEMFREINTIGSKSNDVEIPQYVIATKSAIERIREMVQNVE